MMRLKLWRYACSLLLFVAANSLAVPVSAPSDPHQIVVQTTDKILALLETGIDPAKHTDDFIAQMSEILEPVVAFDYIAKGVLGRYAKQASKEQRLRFTETFKRGLVNTYGAGISGFSHLKFRVLPPEQPLEGVRKVMVIQEVESAGGVTKVAYAMAKNRQQQWKMVNLILNGVNFGQTFRGQFAAAVEKNHGDLDKTIRQWGERIQ